MHEIIYSEEIRNALEAELVNIDNNLQIISAYCKKSALSFVDNLLPKKNIHKQLMVRFRLDDILSGATDIDIFEYCVEKGWSLYVRLDLHAKTFIFDQKRWFVGSANLTANGIGLSEKSNLEMAVLADVDAEEMDKIKLLFESAVLMDERLYALMLAQIEKAKRGGSILLWDDEILNLLSNDVSVLFTHDFPKSRSPKQPHIDDLIMLKLTDSNNTLMDIEEAFLRCNCYRWLVSILNQSIEKELYFGSLTEKLHNVLVNDPKPYRKEVKDLLANLLSWITELEITEVTITRPNHSQLVSLDCQLYIRRNLAKAEHIF